MSETSPAPMRLAYGPNTTAYPCDRATGNPVGYHHFQASPNGVAVCIYCGRKP